jgi:AbiV family abortive infection protein
LGQTELTEDHLLEGSWYALEQAGRLMTTAVHVFTSGDFGTAAGIALLGREELGRSRILRVLAQRARNDGPLNVAIVLRECEDHAAKQKAASGTVTIAGEHGTTLGGLLQISLGQPIRSIEKDTTERQIADIIDRKNKRQPADRHELRVRAFYVDIDHSGHWRRPAEITRDGSYAAVNDVSNDYAQERDRLRDDVIDADFPDMAAAKRRMPPAFELPAPLWPQQAG